VISVALPVPMLQRAGDGRTGQEVRPRGSGELHRTAQESAGDQEPPTTWAALECDCPSRRSLRPEPRAGRSPGRLAQPQRRCSTAVRGSRPLA